MKKSIDLNHYKYIMFVDASGDDGYSFKETSSAGSSFSFVVSCFMTTPEDYEHNKSVLLNMKKAMFVKPEQEIKSTALRRNRNSNKVYEELKNLKGISFSIIADKKLIKKCPPLANEDFFQLTQIAYNDLSGITHTYPYLALSQSGLISDDDKVLIVIDNMKKREMDSIEQILCTEASADKYDLIFRDSKDKNFPLIQIADIMAGTIRHYYEDCLPIGNHNRYCKLCVHTKSQRLNNLKAMCANKKGKKLDAPYIHDERFNIVIRFHQSPGTFSGLGQNIVIIPIDQLIYFMYIECLILQNKRS